MSERVRIGFNSIQWLCMAEIKFQSYFFSIFNLGRVIFSSKSSGFSCINFTSVKLLHFPLVLIVYPLQGNSIFLIKIICASTRRNLKHNI